MCWLGQTVWAVFHATWVGGLDTWLGDLGDLGDLDLDCPGSCGYLGHRPLPPSHRLEGSAWFEGCNPRSRGELLPGDAAAHARGPGPGSPAPRAEARVCGARGWGGGVFGWKRFGCGSSLRTWT